MKKSILLWCFAIALIMELIVVSNPEWIFWRIITKPLLVLLLLFYFLLHETDSKTRLFISLALLFSLLGDVLLLFTVRSENYFMFGLVAFLLAHIFYIVQFSQERNKDLSLLKPVVPIVIFGGTFFYFLKDGLAEMFFPVLIYMTIILLMAFFAFLRKGKVVAGSFQLVLGGAILFLISDGVLAIDKFHNPFGLAGPLIMGTYGSAQLLIVLGILRADKSKLS